MKIFWKSSLVFFRQLQMENITELHLGTTYVVTET